MTVLPFPPAPDAADGRTVVVAAIGDVHDAWDDRDRAMLAALGVDAVWFVGDFGNEAVPVVRAIAGLPLPKAVVLGNHDAWYSASDWGRKQCPYDRDREDRVQQQLDLLGVDHVGYGKREFPELGLTVVGSRPFSWGGPDWKNAGFYRDRYGVTGFAESTARMVAAAEAADCETVAFLAHNGPYGLGDRPDSPCGRDWKPQGGDYGDRDLTDAIDRVRQSERRVPLVVFGHMHHRLARARVREASPEENRLRRAIARDAAGTIYLNVACVPRVEPAADGGSLHHCCRIWLRDGRVLRVASTWTAYPSGAIAREAVWYDAAAAANPWVAPDRAVV